jgi:hypothetical protein
VNGYDIYKYIEFIIFLSYLAFIFLSIQIWFLWKDIDKTELKSKIFSESFIKKSYAYVFISVMFFMIDEFLEGTIMPNVTVYLEFFEMLAIISLVLFAYEWYRIFKKCAHKKSMPLVMGAEKQEQ